MAAGRQDIQNWFDRGIEQNATHMIVVCDTYDYDDYPVFVLSGEDVRERKKDIDGKDMQRVMEVYNLAMSKESQMAKSRAFNY